MAAESETTSPAIRDFQLDASAIGDVKKSVSLFRGDVSFPLKLASLAGPNGLDLNLSAFYSGSTGDQVDTWNLDSPTGVLGLGWSLPFDYIEFQHSGTASYLEGRFVAHINGRSAALVLLNWTNRGNANEQLEFADAGHPLWQFLYETNNEVWTIKRDDGVTMSFGGTSRPDAVQWGVRWDNWVGSSQFASGDSSPQQFGVAWNLSEVRNQWGNTLAYSYKNDNRTVAGSAMYTRASYIKGVRDAYGRTVTFHYDDKDLHEYQPPHTDKGKAPKTSYQDRYETKFLERIDVAAASGELYYSIDFDTRLHNLGDSADGNSTATDTSKRYLHEVRQQRGNRNLLPPLKFDYDLQPRSISRGKITRVTYPQGGSVSWKYDEKKLGDAPKSQADDEKSIFNLQYTANRPTEPDFVSAIPRLWFGPGYIVIVWYSGSDRQMKLQVFAYGGRWAKDPFEDDLAGVSPESIDDIQIAFGSDFFALYFHNQGNPTDDLHVYQQTPYQFGNWTDVSKDDVFKNIQSGNSDTKDTTLVAGDDFIALHPGGPNRLYRFAFDRRTRTWSGAPPIAGPNSETRMALAAQGNVLAVGFFGSGDSQVSVTDQIYWLDTGEKSLTWRERTDGLSQHGSFSWKPEYIQSYMRMGHGFAVGTYPDSNQASLHVTTWSRNFEEFSDHTLPGDFIKSDDKDLPPPTEVSGSTIANRGMLYRYNGSKWSPRTVTWNGNAVAVSEDTVVAAGDSGFDAMTGRFDPRSGSEGEWSVGDLNTPRPAPADTDTPQFGGRFLTVGANLYFHDTNGDLQPVEGPFDAPPTTVACRGPKYVAWEIGDNPTRRSTKVALLLNGHVDDVVSLPDQRIGVPTATGTALTGPTAFATYDTKYEKFEHVPQFTLHRILNRHVDGFPTDCLVAALEVSTGTQTLRTVYSYDTTKAVFDASGRVPQYPHVTAERQDESGVSLGKTTYEYLNGLQPDEEPDSLAQPPDQPVPLAQCYSLANGYLERQTEYSPEGEVDSTQNTWEGVRLSHEFAAMADTVVLKQTRVQQTLHNLPVIALGGAEDTTILTDLTSVKDMEYDPATAYLRGKSETRYNSKGEQETLRTEYQHAWRVKQYSTMRDARLLQSVAQTTLTNEAFPPVPGTVPVVVVSTASTFRGNWNNGSAWGPSATFDWLGEGSAEFDFQPEAERPGWQEQSRIRSRADSGMVTETSDSMGLLSSTLFDRTGIRPICRFVNASVENSQAGYTGFEPYETDQGWTTGEGASIEHLLTATVSHTGSQCLQLPSGGPGLQNTRFVTPAECDYILFGCWVRTPREQTGDVTAHWAITVGTGQAKALAVPNTQGRWEYISARVPVTGDGGPIRCQLQNESELWVDDILVMPLPAQFSATVYDIATFSPIARLGANGEVTRDFYDERLRRIAVTSSDDNVQSTSATFFSRDNSDSDSYDAAMPNAGLLVKARLGGPWDDFPDADFTRRWQPGGSADAWKVHNGRLVHAGPGNESVTLKDSDDFTQYAVRVQVHAEHTPLKPLGIRVGDRLRVQWQPQAAKWEMLVAGESVSSFEGALKGDWLLISMEHSATFFLNGRQILQYVGSPAEPIGGALSLEAADPGVSFAQVLVLRQPIVKMVYSDGTDRAIQQHSLDDGGIVVREVMHDELGRASFFTRPARYDQATPGFRPDFAGPLNSVTGELGGYVSEYYRGQDGRSNNAGYPYTRKRFEMSNLNRLIEVGRPGRQLAIRPDNSHTQRHRYGVNGPAPVFGADDSLPPQKYFVSLTIEPDGKCSASIHDATQTVIAGVAGPAEFPTDSSLATANVLDALGNLRISRPPNSFRVPAGSEASDWWTTAQYDRLGRIVERSDPDVGLKDPETGKTQPGTGVTRYLYDPAGGLRFMLDPAGAARETNVVLYWKYDALGRTVEKGTCERTWGDGKFLQDMATKQPNWPGPNDDVHPDWKKKYFYDGESSDDSSAAADCTVGRLTQGIVRNTGGLEPDVLEDFAYDIQGNVIRKDLRATGYDDKSHIVAYEYDLMGNVIGIDYGVPEEPGGQHGLPKLVYSYDSLGQLTGIGPSPDDPDGVAGFHYYADGRLAAETLAGGSASIPYGYESTGWPAAIGDAQTPFSETLEYGSGDSQGIDEDPSRISIQHNITVDDTQEPPENFQYDYKYDIHGRLKTAMSPQHPNWNLGTPEHPVTYDGNDNILSLTRGQTVESDSYFPGTNRLRSTGETGDEFEYDPNGNMTASAARGLALTYDAFTQMTSTIVARDTRSELSFSYGDNNQRILKTVTSEGGATSSRLYVRGVSNYPQVERTKDSSGAECVVHYIYGAAGLVAMVADGELYFVLRDQERSTRVVLNSNGELAAGYDYFPFGNETRSFGPNADICSYRYTGQEYDPETGLYNYRARMYDANLGRFLGPDPLRQFPSPYVYVGDNPIWLTDPTGESFLSVFDDIVAVVVSVGEIAAAVVVEGASFGGATVVAGGLMGAGVSGISYTATHLNEDDAGKFWGGFGISEATGALSGVLTAGVGSIEVSAGKQIALGVAAGAADAEIQHVGSNLMTMNEGGDADWSGKGFGIAAGVGAFTGGLGAGAEFAKGGLANIESKGLRMGLAVAGGAVVGGVETMGVSLIRGEKIDWRQVGQDAVKGGISGGKEEHGNIKKQAKLAKQQRKPGGRYEEGVEMVAMGKRPPATPQSR